MLGRIKSLTENKLVRGSLVLLIMIGIFNVLNYIFQMSMARMLGPAEYSILAVLMSIVYIFSIPSEAIQTVLARYTSKFGIKNEDGKIKAFLYKSLKKGVLFSVLIFAIFIILSLPLSILLKINFWLLSLTGLIIFYVFSIPIVRGILQGKKRFFSLGINMVIESLIKVIFSVTFVILGWKVYGALVGLLAGCIMATLLVFVDIKDILSSKKEAYGGLVGIYRYNLPVFIGITAIVLIYSLDVILARVFFTPEIAGKYAFVSLIGKVVLFSSFAISKAMFPMSSENFERGERTSGLLKNSLFLVLALAAFMLILCMFIPKQMIGVISLGSSQYLDASNILFFVCLAFSFTAINNILITYSLSVNKIRKSSLFLLFFVILEVILLSIFNSNLLRFSIALVVVNFLMFIYCIGILIKR